METPMSDKIHLTPIDVRLDVDTNSQERELAAKRIRNKQTKKAHRLQKTKRKKVQTEEVTDEVA
jgi:hypothetical protein